MEHIKKGSKLCPICDIQIHKTKPYLSMRMDKALQNIVYKLVPGLYQDEMDRRRKFTEKNEPTKVSKEELEKHFFFRDDKISMSLEYYDPQQKQQNNAAAATNKTSKTTNPNKRYLACPGTVKIQHLMKFITMKYGLNEGFVVDVIYKGDLIPDDYTLIDVAYYYKWEKDSPMQFFYRIFKKNKVLLKRRKRKSKAEDKISDGKKPRPVECGTNNNTNNNNNNNIGNNTPRINGKKQEDHSGSKTSATNGDILGCRTVSSSAPSLASSMPSLKDETKPVSIKIKSSSSSNNKRSHEQVKQKDSPPTLTAAVKVNTKKDVTKTEDHHYPPPEKKLKIDLFKDESFKKTLKVKVTTTSEVVPKTKLENGTIDTRKVEPLKICSPKSGCPKIVQEIKSNMTSTTTTTTTATTPPKIPEVQKPKSPAAATTPTSSVNKSRSSHNMLTNIVNNLAKKQASLSQNNAIAAAERAKSSSSTPSSTPLSTKTSSTSKTALPSTLLGGQTTITKKLVETITTTAAGINKLVNNKSQQKQKQSQEQQQQKRDSNTKGIPSGTSVTVRSVLPTSTLSPALSTPSISTATSTATMSFSNSFKAKSGSTSMMDFVQASSPIVATAKTTNGLSNSASSKKSSTMSDLRQFRKPNMPAGDVSPTPTKPQTTQRTPIIPSLTSSRTLTLSNTKNKNMSPKISSPPRLSPGSSASRNSSFSAALSKPIPKPSSATTSSLLAQANSLAAVAALGFGLTDEQQTMQLFRNMAVAAAMMPPMCMPSVTSAHQQLPSNRLKLTVQSSNAASKTTSSHNSLQFLPSLASHMAPESQWKMFSNKNIRQIPNPSLLTKQASDQQQQQQQLQQQQQQQQQMLQRAIAASQVAAATAAASARTTLS
jgi:hypothetical protein